MELQPLLPQDARLALRERIDHIVVVMMENRSFDHMLGYLTLEGRLDVDGLQTTFANVYDGRTYQTFRLDRTELEHYEDPKHGGKDVSRQIAGGTMGGFVENFIESRPEELRERLKAQNESIVMGYYDAAVLPVYDHLARSFCVCDRWFASVPGATWPNRSYAVAGHSTGRKDNKKLFGRFDFPLSWVPAFVRHLDFRGVDWRWYHARSFDIEPPTLQVVDGRYFVNPGAHFALFEDTEPGGQASFLDDARDGNLAPVTWIDPDFGITAKGESNDDHPPADVRRGQALMQKVVNAVMGSPSWPRTLLVITYDEHGGFYDHVPPPPAADDDGDMRTHGVRVPAFVVSPFVPEGSVAHLTFDHTSIIRTVLERFCSEADGSIPWMGARVAAAEHFGRLLTLENARAAAPVAPDAKLPDDMAPSEHIDLSTAELIRLASPRTSSLVGQEIMAATGGPEPINDVQLGLLRAGLERRWTLNGGLAGDAG
jgi:phospholipase C